MLLDIVIRFKGIVQHFLQENKAHAGHQTQQAGNGSVHGLVGRNRGIPHTGIRDDLYGTGFHRLLNHIGGDFHNFTHNSLGLGGVFILHRDLHDLGGVHRRHAYPVGKLLIGHIQAQLFDHLIQNRVALYDDTVGRHQILGGGQHIVGQVGAGLALLRVYDHGGTGLILRSDQEIGNQKAHNSAHDGACHNGQQIIFQHEKYFTQVYGLVFLLHSLSPSN